MVDHHTTTAPLDDTLRPLWQQSYLGKTFGDNLDNIVKAFTRNSWRLSLVHLKRQLWREPSENSQTTFDFMKLNSDFFNTTTTF